MSKKDFPFFKFVTIINDPKEGIAKSCRATGELVINKCYFNKLSEAHQFFVLAHEEGHIFLNTSDELNADAHAAKRYFEAGYPLSESVKVLAQVLDTKKPVHVARAWMQYNRALQYDYQVNKNNKAFRPFYENRYTVIEKLKNKTL